MLSYRTLALAASTMLCATSAHAATIVQTGGATGGGSVFFNRFDGRLGSLNSVTVDAAFQAVFFFRYPEQLGNPTVSATGTIGTSDSAILNFSGAYAVERYDPGIISIFIGGPAQGVFTGDLSRYVGSGLIGFGPSATISAAVAGAPIDRINPPVTGQGSARYTVTYDFTPSVPEPSTWALMLAGFGMVGYAMRRRRPQIVYA